MGDQPISVFGVVYIPYLPWFLEWSCAQFHSFDECWAYEAVGCSTVYKCFLVGHCAAGSDGNRDSHGLKSHSYYYRIELMNCPHPG